MIYFHEFCLPFKNNWFFNDHDAINFACDVTKETFLGKNFKVMDRKMRTILKFNFPLKILSNELWITFHFL